MIVRLEHIRLVNWEDINNSMIYPQDEVTVWLAKPIKGLVEIQAKSIIIDSSMWSKKDGHIITELLERVQTKYLVIISKEFEFPHLKKILEIASNSKEPIEVEY